MAFIGGKLTQYLNLFFVAHCLCLCASLSVAHAEPVVGLNIAYAPAYGVLEQRSLAGTVRAVLPRMLGGALSVFYQSEGSRYRYLVQYSMSYDLKISSVDFNSTSAGVQMFWYHPGAIRDGVVKTSERSIEPYVKVMLAHAQQTSNVLNSTNENIESVKVSNLGVVAYGGATYGKWFAEGGLLAAPVSLSTPAFMQLWVMVSAGLTLSSEN